MRARGLADLVNAGQAMQIRPCGYASPLKAEAGGG